VGDIVKHIFSGFTDTITNFASGIKDAFLQIIYVDPAAETKVLSDVAQFGFVMVGISLAIGLVYGAIRLIRR